MEKREIRRQVLSLRDNLSSEDRKRGALLLTERLLGHQWFYLAEEILIFASFGSEIDTSELCEETLRRGKALYLPKVTAEGEMLFFRVGNMGELQAGYRGIPEPSGTGDAEIYVYRRERAEKTLMVVPGVAFDREKNRIGYGKGFYDRFLSDKPALQRKTIGVGFCCQMVDKIPADEGDIRLCQVICV